MKTEDVVSSKWIDIRIFDNHKHSHSRSRSKLRGNKQRQLQVNPANLIQNEMSPLSETKLA
jgi:hypothetical protein